MTKLIKLLISGIRSYNPSSRSTITFNNPLTLIVGPNGSGKTTIIEALKFILTNDMPSNTKGNAFLYDPRLIDSLDTKALLKLKIEFNNTIDQKSITKEGLCDEKENSSKLLLSNEFIITKSMQSNIRKTTHTFKTIDTKIQHKDKILPTRSDNDLLTLLNTNKPLLDFVFFCHQEESNWILEEPGLVKKRLDEIFSLSRFSKALDLLKVQKREVNVLIKIKNMELETLSMKKNKKDQILRNANECLERINMIEEELKIISLEVMDLNEEKIKAELESCKEEHMTYIKTVEDIKRLECKTFLGERYELIKVFEELKNIVKELRNKNNVNCDNLYEYTLINEKDENQRNDFCSNVNNGIENKENDNNNTFLHYKNYKQNCKNANNSIMQNKEDVLENVENMLNNQDYNFCNTVDTYKVDSLSVNESLIFEIINIYQEIIKKNYSYFTMYMQEQKKKIDECSVKFQQYEKVYYTYKKINSTEIIELYKNIEKEFTEVIEIGKKIDVFVVQDRIKEETASLNNLQIENNESKEEILKEINSNKSITNANINLINELKGNICYEEKCAKIKNEEKEKLFLELKEIESFGNIEINYDIAEVRNDRENFMQIMMVKQTELNDLYAKQSKFFDNKQNLKMRKVYLNEIKAEVTKIKEKQINHLCEKEITRLITFVNEVDITKNIQIGFFRELIRKLDELIISQRKKLK